MGSTWRTTRGKAKSGDECLRRRSARRRRRPTEVHRRRSGRARGGQRGAAWSASLRQPSLRFHTPCRCAVGSCRRLGRRLCLRRRRWRRAGLSKRKWHRCGQRTELVGCSKLDPSWGGVRSRRGRGEASGTGALTGAWRRRRRRRMSWRWDMGRRAEDASSRECRAARGAEWGRTRGRGKASSSRRRRARAEPRRAGASSCPHDVLVDPSANIWTHSRVNCVGATGRRTAADGGGCKSTALSGQIGGGGSCVLPGPEGRGPPCPWHPLLERVVCASWLKVVCGRSFPKFG